MSKSNSKRNCNPFEGGEVPPCSAFLGNINPIIKDGELIFTNNNRIYCFISTSCISSNSTNKNSFGNSNIQTNIQVSLATFLIGLYINQVEIGNINHSKENKIHNNKVANDFINETLQKNPRVTVDYTPSLIFVISNTNAILNLFNDTINISPLNYYILFILNRLENNPGLFFGNNAFTTEDPINFRLSSLALKFPFE